MTPSPQFVACADLKFKLLDDECLVYEVKTGETRLLERFAGDILQCVNDCASTCSEIMARHSNEKGTIFDASFVESTLAHLVNAGLIKNIE